MRTKQDGVPTHRLSKQMATDAHGRVLRRPYFLTKEEHDRAMQKTAASLVEMVETERRKKEALAGALADLIANHDDLHRESERLRSECEMLVNLKVRRRAIRCRARFHWLLRWLIKID